MFIQVESNALIDAVMAVNHDDLKNCDVHCKYLVASVMMMTMKPENNCLNTNLKMLSCTLSLLTLSMESLAQLQFNACI